MLFQSLQIKSIHDDTLTILIYLNIGSNSFNMVFCESWKPAENFSKEIFDVFRSNRILRNWTVGINGHYFWTVWIFKTFTSPSQSSTFCQSSPQLTDLHLCGIVWTKVICFDTCIKILRVSKIHEKKGNKMIHPDQRIHLFLQRLAWFSSVKVNI